MKLETLSDYQVWASGFFLTRPLTHTEIDNLSWDEFDQSVKNLTRKDYEYFSGAQIWNRITSLADYAYLSHKEKTND